ncbi:MAG: monovalent cation:proton antiporter-2 (CPA2) family protein [Gammaproteobacteria bacterium]|nr:monovalent cation:proton antiporter-2 (CPA2) family protein [Gammaproteobacteria bacterium]
MTDILHSLVALLLAAVIAVPIFRRLGLGSVLGYLVAGIVVGPSVMGLFSDPDALLHIAEFGVVLLLFIIGLELQPSRLWVLRRSLLTQGGGQVMITGTLFAAIATWWLGDLGAGIVVGFGLALSSTAFVLQLLAERDELPMQHGRASFAVLLFQDLAVIPLIALVPLLAGADQGTPLDMLLDSLLVLGIFGGIVVVGRFLLRHGLRLVNSSGLREVSTAAALLVVVGISVIMETLGLSMALGAFTAGVLLADSEYRHQLEADIEPFKGLLLGLFFMSVGMSANLSLLASEPLLIAGIAALLVIAKLAVLAVIAIYSRMSLDTGLRFTVVLSQGGEFGFVLFSAAGQAGLLAAESSEQLVLAVTLSMVSTPLLYGLLNALVLPRLAKASQREYDHIDEPASPVVIAGFGRFGQMTGRLLRTLDIPFTALDISSDQVDVVRRFGNRVHYGDASREDLLHAAKAGEAKVFVIAVDDMEASLKIARLLKKQHPKLKILARARNRKHAHLLMDLGVEWLVRETQWSALRMAEEVLASLDMPVQEARRLVDKFREHDEVSLVRQHAVHHDSQEFMQSARQAADELRGIFEDDRRVVQEQRKDRDH